MVRNENVRPFVTMNKNKQEKNSRKYALEVEN